MALCAKPSATVPAAGTAVNGCGLARYSAGKAAWVVSKGLIEDAELPVFPSRTDLSGRFCRRCIRVALFRERICAVSFPLGPGARLAVCARQRIQFGRGDPDNRVVAAFVFRLHARLADQRRVTDVIYSHAQRVTDSLQTERDEALERARGAPNDIDDLGMYESAKAAFIRLYHPDNVGGNAVYKAAMKRVYEVYMAELERIEKGT